MLDETKTEGKARIEERIIRRRERNIAKIATEYHPSDPAAVPDAADRFIGVQRSERTDEYWLVGGATLEATCASLADDVQRGWTPLAMFDLDEYARIAVDVECVVKHGDSSGGDNPLACDCDDDRVPGACWPMASGGNAQLPWVERCDDCQRFADDEEAARAVAHAVGGHVAHADLSGCQRPFVFAVGHRVLVGDAPGVLTARLSPDVWRVKLDGGSSPPVRVAALTYNPA
jgi:hypothetical protein